MIDIVDDGRVRTITFLRPEAKNAMNTEMWDATTEAFLAAADDPGVAVVVLTGSESGGACCWLRKSRALAALRRHRLRDSCLMKSTSWMLESGVMTASPGATHTARSVFTLAH